jgi:asparagine synthase (glutamine-hydrolysing)
VALQCRQPHQTITIGKEFLREFPKLAEQSVHISDGTMDVTGSVEIYANRIARGIAPVRITGNYGSELLRSNVAFRPSSLPREIFCQEISDLSNLATKTYKEETKAERLSFIAYKQVPWHHFGRFSIEQSQLRVQSPFLDNELVRLLFRAPQDCIASVEPTLRLIARGNPALARIPTDRGIKWPAARIMNSLRHSYHDLWARSEYAYDYGMPRWLTSVDRRLALLKPERFFLGRQKFCHFRVWYKNELSAFIKEVLLDPRSLRRAYVNPTGLTQALGDHLSGRVNHTNSLHKLLSMELFHRKFIDQ